MTDTDYTQGFKNGMDWQTKNLTRMLENVLYTATNAETKRFLIQLSDSIKGTPQKNRVEILDAHIPTGESVAGFLGRCSCGEAIDDYREHVNSYLKEEIALIKGERQEDNETVSLLTEGEK